MMNRCWTRFAVGIDSTRPTNDQTSAMRLRRPLLERRFAAGSHDHLGSSIRTELALPKSQIPRGRTPSRNDLALTERWLTPLEHAELAPAADVVGQDSAIVLRTDSPIRQRDLKPKQLIRRGDTVHVDCLVGGGVISMKAVATEGAALGDVITLRKGRDRESFTAKVTGSGRAMVDRNTTIQELAGTKLAGATTSNAKDIP